MDSLKRQRGLFKGQITRASNFLERLPDPTQVSSSQVSTRIKVLETSWNDYKLVIKQILELVEGAEETTALETDYEEVESKYCSTDAGLVELLAKLKLEDPGLSGQSQSQMSQTAPTATADVKLPKMDLPIFSGDYMEWTSFKDLFTSIVHKNEKISASQKLHYLKTSLRGNASDLLQSIDITDANYLEAWNLLQDRYQNERQLVHCHLKSLTSQATLHTETAAGLRKLLDTTVKCIRSLHALKISTDQWDPILVFIVTERMDSDSRRHWELASPGKTYPKFEDVKAFIEQRCRALEATPLNKASQQRQDNPKIKVFSKATSSYLSSTNAKCCVCDSNHSIYQCKDYSNMDLVEKNALVKRLSLCFNCLRPNHSSRQCQSKSTCRKCNGKHHTSLHGEERASSQAQYNAYVNANQPSTVLSSYSGKGNQVQILLSTAMIKIKDSFGRYQQCRALLDSGSQASFITESCVQRLGLHRTKADIPIHGIGQSVTEKTRGKVALRFSSIATSFDMDIEALILHKITNQLPNSFVDIKHWRHLSNITLADPTFNTPGNVEILLGADVYNDILIDGRIQGQKRQPPAQNTKLGWILGGKIDYKDCRDIKYDAVSHLSTLDIHDQLKKFWELEEVQTKNHLTPEEIECETHFLETYTRDTDGRFTVSLPFKKDNLELGCSKDMALKRLDHLETRLERFPKYKEQYHEFMDEYLRLGHMEPVPLNQQAENPSKTNYLLHHFVLKESSTTTRLRVVFDASAKTTSGVSMNEKLMIGPKIQEDIFDIMLRFRLYKYAFTADISKMYRQVNVTPSDMDFQRILWRKSPEDPVQEFRLRTVTYGTASAPYLATKSLQQAVVEDGHLFPFVKEIILKDFFVDDLMSGSNSLDNGITIQTQLNALLQRSRFPLRKWSANHPSLLESLPEEYRETKSPLLNNSEDSIKALGIFWNPTSDHFFFIISLQVEVKKINKRHVLADVSRLFDPLGWLAPVIILGKVLFQKLWIRGLPWDEPLPSDLETEWLQFRNEIFKLNDLKIQRCTIDNEGQVLQLHGFCDASEVAYGAAVYLRSEDVNGNVSVHLLCAKTRVAPVKQVSIPRLELCGAHLLARLIRKVIQTFNQKHNAIYGWTDSTITLAWIAAHPSKWKTFVANRVSEIQDVLPPESWRHVPTTDNPADLASRGVLPEALISNQLWWTGPSWLSRDTSFWPRLPSTIEQEELPEQKVKSIQTMAVKMFNEADLISRHSSLTRLQRVTAFCFRFIRNVRCPQDQRNLGALNTTDLKTALQFLIKTVQAQEFSDTLEAIRKERAIPSQLNSLNPFIDSDGLLRVGGRLNHSTSLTYEKKHPIILPKSHHFTQLVIAHEHSRQLHAGPQLTLASLQQKFWVLNGRNAVRHHIFKCIKCFRDRAANAQQIMGDLPTFRLEPTRPFLRTGVDFGGPLTIKSWKGRGGRLYKCYIALFVCFSTKAIHIELVSDLSTEAFIAALKRFIARRGRCSDIFSDNGTNFVGANNELRDLQRLFKSQVHNTTVADFLSSDGTNWHFIPPKAPHFGGLWEAGIKSVKGHMRRIIGNTNLTFEEMYTILLQIEACLNSRPITAMSSDPSDLRALTPGHFLIGDALTSIPEPDLITTKSNCLSRWQLTQQLSQHFWKRWHMEYLSQLQQRPKWASRKDNVQVDDLVLIKEDNIPPLHWILGRIVDVHPGRDHLIRVVSVRTANGVLKRPLVKICPLPKNSSS